MSFDDQTELEEQKTKATRTWLLSFIDLLSLLLAFFVLLYSTKDVSRPEYMQEIKDSFIKYINGKKPEKEYKFVQTTGMSSIIKSASNPNYIESLFKSALYNDPTLDINIINDNNKVTLEMTQGFKDETDLINSLTNKLITLSKTINSLTNQIQVISNSGDLEKDKIISELVSNKIEELGYEHKILRTLPMNNFIPETLEKDKKETKISIIINNYESIF